MGGSRLGKRKLYRAGGEPRHAAATAVCYPSARVRVDRDGAASSGPVHSHVPHGLPRRSGARARVLRRRHAVARSGALPFAGLLLSIAFAPLVAPKLWHDHYGKIAALLALALLIPFTRHVRGRGGAAQRRARDRARIRSLSRHAVRALHDRRRHLPSRHARRNPGRQHRPPRPGRLPRERHGDDRRVDAADPAAPHRQRDAAPSRARRRVLHPARRQRGRRAVAARRSAAFHRLPQRRRLLLDDPRARAADAVSLRRAARACSTRSTRCFTGAKAPRAVPADRSNAAVASRACRISCCSPA